MRSTGWPFLEIKRVGTLWMPRRAAWGAPRLGRRGVERRRDHPARAAPRGPTVEQHGQRPRRAHHLVLEGLVRHGQWLHTRIRPAPLRAGPRLPAVSIQRRAAPTAHRLLADDRHALVHAVLRAALPAGQNRHRRTSASPAAVESFLPTSVTQLRAATKARRGSPARAVSL